jgi:hypothetical protein
MSLVFSGFFWFTPWALVPAGYFFIMFLISSVYQPNKETLQKVADQEQRIRSLETRVSTLIGLRQK